MLSKIQGLIELKDIFNRLINTPPSPRLNTTESWGDLEKSESQTTTVQKVDI